MKLQIFHEGFQCKILSVLVPSFFLSCKSAKSGLKDSADVYPGVLSLKFMANLPDFLNKVNATILFIFQVKKKW